MRIAYENYIISKLHKAVNVPCEQAVLLAEQAKASVKNDPVNTKSIQRMLICFVCDAFGDKVYSLLDGRRTELEDVLKQANLLLLPSVSTRTMRRWVYHFLKFGETPSETIEWRKRCGLWKRRTNPKWSDEETKVLRELVEDSPWKYLDEFQIAIRNATGKTFSTNLIWMKLRKDLRFSLQKAFQRASQWDEEERSDYIFWRDWHLSRPDMAVFIDETHKGRNEARRRRIWSHIGRTAYYDSNFFGGLKDRRYTMLAACDVNGFIYEACELVRKDGDCRNEEEGTIDTKRFELWVKDMLCPTLGNYAAEEPRSVVILDNASIHHSDEVVRLIEAAGAKVLYAAPFSADLNPIENMFGEYKKGLKRHSPYMPWYEAHVEALTSITPKMSRGFFRGCGIQGCEEEESTDIESLLSSELQDTLQISISNMMLYNIDVF